MKRIVIAAGGTGGHIVPGLAIAEELRRASEVIFVGTGRELERKLVGGAGFPLEELPAAPLLGKGLRGVLHLAKVTPGAFSKTRNLFRRLRPDVVVGFGGYPTVMPALAAVWAGVPVVLHESNVRVGLANRALSLGARQVFGVPESGAFLSANVTRLPNPVREQFYDISSLKLPAGDEPWRLLITGGSQGAMSLNTAVASLAPMLRDNNISVWHQTGASDRERILNIYRAAGLGEGEARVDAFIDQFSEALRWAHVVVCRAGAMTVAEVSAAGRPAIFVPLPIAGGHQADNCRALVRAGLSLEVKQEGEFSFLLGSSVQSMLRDRGALDRMAEGLRRAAAYQGKRPALYIAEKILEIAENSKVRH